ncbi:hypothetical protein JXA32_16400 [Candidatus Sumerlaeota bacterium]|nr:hypothetical protein [Candidatus Sumerlaeota bacterium]
MKKRLIYIALALACAALYTNCGSNEDQSKPAAQKDEWKAPAPARPNLSSAKPDLPAPTPPSLAHGWSDEPDEALTGAQDDAEGRTFEMDGKQYTLFNRNAQMEQYREDKDHNPIYVQAIGDVELISNDFRLRCRRLEYKSEDGLMVAEKWPEKQVQLTQGDSVSYTDKLVNYTQKGEVHLLGDACVYQQKDGDSSDMRGDKIVRKETEDGGAIVDVDGHPVLVRKSSEEPAATEAADQNADADDQQIKTLEASVGKNFTLKADPEKGTFHVISNAAGEMETFTAKNNVKLDAENMDLESDVFKILDTGKRVEATGELVKIKQGDVDAECSKFVHFPDDKKTELYGWKDKPATVIQQGIKSMAGKFELTENDDNTMNVVQIGKPITTGLDDKNEAPKTPAPKKTPKPDQGRRSLEAE